MVGPFRLEDAVKAELISVDALRPIDASLFEKLQLPCFFVDSKTEEGFIHGKDFDSLFKAESLPLGRDATAAGIFARESSMFLGFLEHKNGKWGYGYVFAGD
jgi:hypothetical protein